MGDDLGTRLINQQWEDMQQLWAYLVSDEIKHENYSMLFYSSSLISFINDNYQTDNQNRSQTETFTLFIKHINCKPSFMYFILLLQLFFSEQNVLKNGEIQTLTKLQAQAATTSDTYAISWGHFMFLTSALHTEITTEGLTLLI